MTSQLSLFTLPECFCGMGPYVHPDGVDLWCACGVEVFEGPAGYLDWLAAGPATKEPEQKEIPHAV